MLYAAELEKGVEWMQLQQKIGLFGVPFDPLPSQEALLIKQSYIQAKAMGKRIRPDYPDPYDYFSKNLPLINSQKFDLLGKVSIPTWLQPKPQIADTNKLSVHSLKNFIEDNGCFTIADKVHEFIVKNVYHRIPGMIGVDHSSTYGAISALVEHGGELSLVVLDSHCDVVPMDLRYGLIEWAKEKRPFDLPPDFLSDSGNISTPLLEVESDKLTMENFLLHLIQRKLLSPENLVLVGFMDYPDKPNEVIGDPRWRNYINFFKSLEKEGACFISGASVRKNGVKDTLEKALQNLKTRRVYVSLDIDIGSLSSVFGCRFLNTRGLLFNQITDIFQSLFKAFSSDLTLAGFDLMEVDIHKLGTKIDNSREDKAGKIGKLFLDLVGKVV